MNMFYVLIILLFNGAFQLGAVIVEPGREFQRVLGVFTTMLETQRPLDHDSVQLYRQECGALLVVDRRIYFPAGTTSRDVLPTVENFRWNVSGKQTLAIEDTLIEIQKIHLRPRDNTSARSRAAIKAKLWLGFLKDQRRHSSGLLFYCEMANNLESAEELPVTADDNLFPDAFVHQQERGDAMKYIVPVTAKDLQFLQAFLTQEESLALQSCNFFNS